VSQLALGLEGGDDAAPLAVRVACDGGARGNPGPAAIGAVVTAVDDGRVLATVSEYIGETTNNVAEYRAVIAGLQRAADLGAGSVDVRADSLLVVNQLLGRWKVKQAHLVPLHREARDLLGRFDATTVERVRREHNADADALVNAALDAHASGARARTARSSSTGLRR
jgi:ribonuclease HI